MDSKSILSGNNCLAACCTLINVILPGVSAENCRLNNTSYSFVLLCIYLGFSRYKNIAVVPENWELKFVLLPITNCITYSTTLSKAITFLSLHCQLQKRGGKDANLMKSLRNKFQNYRFTSLSLLTFGHLNTLINSIKS